jgi:hypothetical protein
MVLGVILLFLGSNIPAFAHTNKNNHSSSRENILYVGGSGLGNYSKIQDAVNDSHDGDMIIVFPRFYQEIVNINTSIILKGIDHPIVDGNLSFSVITLAANGITIDGFIVQNAGLNHSDFPEMTDIYCAEGNASIKNNHFLGISCVGVFNRANDVSIVNNTFQETSVGLWATDCCRINISHNHFSKKGMILDGVYDSVINHNFIFNMHGSGILCSLGGTINFTGNLFTNCSYGLYLSYMEGGVYVLSNTFQQCGYGLWCGYSHSYEYIGRNNFLNNQIASSFELNDFYTGTWLHYYSNYWNRPRVLPEIILGKRGYYLPYPWIHFDWTPTKRPYDIPTMNLRRGR